MQLISRTAATPLLLALLAQPSLGQTAQASIAIERAQPTCTVSVPDDVSFGANVRPSDDDPPDGSITIGYNGAVSRSGGLTAGSGSSSASAGRAVMVAENVTTWSISVTPPSSLAGDEWGLAFAFEWGEGSSISGGRTEITGTTFSVSGLPGEGSTDRHYFTLGGTVSGIERSTPAGTYTATITLTGTCS